MVVSIQTECGSIMELIHLRKPLATDPYAVLKVVVWLTRTVSETRWAVYHMAYGKAFQVSPATSDKAEALKICEHFNTQASKRARCSASDQPGTGA